MNAKAFFKMSYGMFVVCSKDGEKMNGGGEQPSGRNVLQKENFLGAPQRLQSNKSEPYVSRSLRVTIPNQTAELKKKPLHPRVISGARTPALCCG